MKNNIPKILLFSYIAIILITAVISLNGTSKALNDTYIFELRSDYLIHALLFFVLMFLISLAYDVTFKKKIKSTVYWIIAALIIATVSEGVQYFLTYRAFNINDLAANITGVVLGAFFFFMKYRFFRRAK